MYPFLCHRSGRSCHQMQYARIFPRQELMSLSQNLLTHGPDGKSSRTVFRHKAVQFLFLPHLRYFWSWRSRRLCQRRDCCMQKLYNSIHNQMGNGLFCRPLCNNDIPHREPRGTRCCAPYLDSSGMQEYLHSEVDKSHLIFRMGIPFRWGHSSLQMRLPDHLNIRERYLLHSQTTASQWKNLRRELPLHWSLLLWSHRSVRSVPVAYAYGYGQVLRTRWSHLILQKQEQRLHSLLLPLLILQVLHSVCGCGYIPARKRSLQVRCLRLHLRWIPAVWSDLQGKNLHPDNAESLQNHRSRLLLFPVLMAGYYYCFSVKQHFLRLLFLLMHGVLQHQIFCLFHQLLPDGLQKQHLTVHPDADLILLPVMYRLLPRGQYHACLIFQFPASQGGFRS